MNTKHIHIIGGGTASHVRFNLALASQNFGDIALDIGDTLREVSKEFPDTFFEVTTRITKIGGSIVDTVGIHDGEEIAIPQELSVDELKEEIHQSKLHTNEDVAYLFSRLKLDPDPKIVFLPLDLCEFDVVGIDVLGDGWQAYKEPGETLEALSIQNTKRYGIWIEPSKITLEGLIKTLRAGRKDIKVVGFLNTVKATQNEQLQACAGFVKNTGCDLVMATDTMFELSSMTTWDGKVSSSGDENEILVQVVREALR